MARAPDIRKKGYFPKNYKTFWLKLPPQWVPHFGPGISFKTIHHRIPVPRAGFLLLPLLLFFLVSLPFPAAYGEDQSRKEFWIGRYGEIREGQLVSRGREIFSRVVAAADRRAGLEPSFHIISYGGLPWAQSLSDGSILLTRKAVEFCYKGRLSEEGDARLAFVLGIVSVKLSANDERRSER